METETKQIMTCLKFLLRGNRIPTEGADYDRMVEFVKIYFGEVTFSNGGGRTPFNREFDQLMGECWKLLVPQSFAQV